MSDELVLLSTREKRALLCRCDLFGRAGPDALDALAAAAELREVETGAVLVRQGAEADALYLLVHGHAEVRLEAGEDEDGVVLDQLGPGALVGEVSVLTDEPRTATVRATDMLVALRLPRAEMLGTLALHPDLAQDIWTSVARRRLEGLLAASHRFAGQGEQARHWLAGGVTPVFVHARSAQILTCPGTLFVVSGQVEAETELGWTCVRGPALLPCVGPVECHARTDAVVAAGPPLSGLSG
ncbi:cyclic nucleotide-binding domain-containing protein [Myxococcota bacterium]|nr:cyclic nucleotide-binding domain-containing protein [Myxococcota bacterium]